MAENDWIKNFSEKGFALDRLSTLLIAIFFTSAALMTIVIPFIERYYHNSYLNLLLLIIPNLIIFIYWFYYKHVFPTGNKEKQNLIISIITEDSKQKKRITKDLVNEINKQLKDFGLSDSYNLITLNNSLSSKIQKKLKLWVESKKEDLDDSKDIIAFKKITKKLNAKFIVYGNLIRRNEGNSRYFMSIEALIMHAKTNEITSKTLQREFRELWKREVSFLESDELNGFKSNANQIFFSATYMLGLATLVDNNLEKGIKIWERLEYYISENKDLKKFHSKIIQLKYISY